MGPTIVSAYRNPGRDPTEDEAALWSVVPLSESELNAAAYARAYPSEPEQPVGRLFIACLVAGVLVGALLFYLALTLGIPLATQLIR